MHNFEQIVKNYWERMNHASEDIKTEYNTWKTLRSKVIHLNEEKKIRSAEIGRLRKSGQAVQNKIEALAKLTKEIKVTKKELRFLQEKLEQWINNNTRQDDLPSRLFKKKQPVTVSEYSVRSASEVKDQAIDDFVNSSSDATLYHLSCWKRLICNLFGHHDFSLVATDTHNTIVGYLPLIHMRSHLFGNFACSVPFFNYGGPVSVNESISESLINKAIEIGHEKQLSHIEFREITTRKHLQNKSEKVSMIRRLPASKEQLHRELGTKLRAQIKRSIADKPIFFSGKQELLDDFYSIFSKNMRDLGTPVYPRKFFSSVIETWQKKAYICIVYLSNKPVAAAIVLGFKDTLEIPWASALRSTNHLGINMYLYWNILCLAIEKGYDFFDFGRSNINSGTFRFKQQWGAKPVTNHWNYWLPSNTELPQLNPNNPKYRLMISIWKHLPVTFTNLLGPYIVRNIP